MFCWLSGAVVCYFAIGALQRVAHLPIQAVGGGALLCNFALSAPMACIKAAPVPKSEKAVPSGTYALRGSLAASVVGAAVLVSRWDPALAGIGAGFPAIALASLVSLWVSRGERVIAGAIGPVMLGGLSASTYCIAFGTLYAILFGAGLGQPLSLLLALSASYLSAVVLVSMPVFVSFSWVAAITRKRRSRQLETAEEEGVMVEEEDEENGQQQPHLNNRGAVMTEWTKGEATPLLLAATTSGHHPTYHACTSGENDWKGREDCVSRMAVRRHLSEETEQRIKMKGHDRPSSHDHHHEFDESGQGDETDKKKKNEETRRWVDVVVNPEASATTTEPAALQLPAMTAGSCAVAAAVEMGGSGEVEGKLQPNLNQRTLTPLR